jgi:hypothetical protein
MKEQWESDFKRLRERCPCLVSRLAQPRLVFLPPWWPSRFSCFVVLWFVCIGPVLPSTSDDVRFYVLGHEYGHIRCNHTLIASLWYLVVICIYGLLLLSRHQELTLLVVVVPTLGALLAISRRWELQADRMALEMFEPGKVLAGSLWMAEKHGTIKSAFRKKRLNQMGWDGRL